METAPLEVDPFARDYADARRRFLAACADAGAALESHRHPLPGPDGAPLFLDAARLGPTDAHSLLMIGAGTHGVEGFCGSGALVDLLDGGIGGRLPQGVALLLVHAINPYGFAWLRRVNEDNVDVNRNFLDHRGEVPGNPLYERVYAALNPTRYDDASVARCLEQIRDFMEEVGMPAAYQALSGGQYTHPEGLQYGGRGPVWSHRTLHRIWERHLRGVERVVNIDIHSGLGSEGIGLVFQTERAGSEAARLAESWWPDVMRAEPAEGSRAALVSGLLGAGLADAHPDATTVAVVLEFGTRDQTEVILATHADNWLHAHGDLASEQARRIKQRLRDAFYIETPEWKRSVLGRTREVVDAALEGLAEVEAGHARGSDPRVREACAADVETLVEFNRAMARETEDKDLDPRTLADGVRRVLAEPDLGRYFVVESGESVIAALLVTTEWSDWRNGLFWWIQSVYVRPEARRQGHYRRLHGHVLERAARHPDVCGLRLYVERENEAAQRTYRSLGMSETAYRLFEAAV